MVGNVGMKTSPNAVCDEPSDYFRESNKLRTFHLNGQLPLMRRSLNWGITISLTFVFKVLFVPSLPITDLPRHCRRSPAGSIDESQIFVVDADPFRIRDFKSKFLTVGRVRAQTAVPLKS